MASTTSFASLNTDVLTEILLRLDGWAVVRLARACSWILRHLDWPTLVAKRLQSERMGEPALFTALDDLDCLQSDLERWQNPAQTLGQRLLSTLQTLQSRLDAGCVQWYSRYHQSSMTQSSLVMEIPPASGLCDAMHLPKDTKALTLSLQAQGNFYHDGEQILLAGGLPVLAEHFYHMKSDEWTPMLLKLVGDGQLRGNFVVHLLNVIRLENRENSMVQQYLADELADGDIMQWNERRDLGPSQAADEWTPASADDPREWAANPQLDEPWSQSRTNRDWVALTKDTTPKVFLSVAPEQNGVAVIGAHFEEAEIPEYSDFNEGFTGHVFVKPAPQDQPPESEAVPLEFKVEGSMRQQYDYDYDPFIKFDIARQVRAGPGTRSCTSILQRDGYQAAAAALGLGDNSNVRPGAVLLAIFVLTLGPKDCVAAWQHMACWNDPDGDDGVGEYDHSRAFRELVAGGSWPDE
ncbi:hypothetical protein HDU88_001587 [Geranomyces variabilis]|nr:hypothetical protein HDU88_001587 [Geranomyces variabilis]